MVKLQIVTENEPAPAPAARAAAAPPAKAPPPPDAVRVQDAPRSFRRDDAPGRAGTESIFLCAPRGAGVFLNIPSRFPAKIGAVAGAAQAPGPATTLSRESLWTEDEVKRLIRNEAAPQNDALHHAKELKARADDAFREDRLYPAIAKWTEAANALGRSRSLLKAEPAKAKLAVACLANAARARVALAERGATGSAKLAADAVADATEACELDPDHARSRYYRCKALLLAGRADEAAAAADWLCEREPTNAAATQLRRVVKRARGDRPPKPAPPYDLKEGVRSELAAADAAVEAFHLQAEAEEAAAREDRARPPPPPPPNAATPTDSEATDAATPPDVLAAAPPGDTADDASATTRDTIPAPTDATMPKDAAATPADPVQPAEDAAETPADPVPPAEDAAATPPAATKLPDLMPPPSHFNRDVPRLPPPAIPHDPVAAELERIRASSESATPAPASTTQASVRELLAARKAARAARRPAAPAASPEPERAWTTLAEEESADVAAAIARFDTGADVAPRLERKDRGPSGVAPVADEHRADWAALAADEMEQAVAVSALKSGAAARGDDHARRRARKELRKREKRRTAGAVAPGAVADATLLELENEHRAQLDAYKARRERIKAERRGVRGA